MGLLKSEKKTYHEGHEEHEEKKTKALPFCSSCFSWFNIYSIYFTKWCEHPVQQRACCHEEKPLLSYFDNLRNVHAITITLSTRAQVFSLHFQKRTKDPRPRVDQVITRTFLRCLIQIQLCTARQKEHSPQSKGNKSFNLRVLRG